MTSSIFMLFCSPLRKDKRLQCHIQLIFLFFVTKLAGSLPSYISTPHEFRHTRLFPNRLPHTMIYCSHQNKSKAGKCRNLTRRNPTTEVIRNRNRHHAWPLKGNLALYIVKQSGIIRHVAAVISSPAPRKEYFRKRRQ